MKKDKRWFTVLIVGILVLVGLGIFYYANQGKIGRGDANQSQASSTSKSGNSALELNDQQLPDFKLTSPDGRELSISSFSDKPFLIVEWASCVLIVEINYLSSKKCTKNMEIRCILY